MKQKERQKQYMKREVKKGTRKEKEKCMGGQKPINEKEKEKNKKTITGKKG